MPTQVGGSHLLLVVLNAQKEPHDHKTQIPAVNVNCATNWLLTERICLFFLNRRGGEKSLRKKKNHTWSPVPIPHSKSHVVMFDKPHMSPAISIGSQIEEARGSVALGWNTPWYSLRNIPDPSCPEAACLWKITEEQQPPHYWRLLSAWSCAIHRSSHLFSSGALNLPDNCLSSWWTGIFPGARSHELPAFTIAQASIFQPVMHSSCPSFSAFRVLNLKDLQRILPI